MADFTITWVGDKPPHTYKGNATYSVAVRDDASGAENRKVKLEQSESDAAPTVGQKLVFVSALEDSDPSLSVRTKYVHGKHAGQQQANGYRLKRADSNRRSIRHKLNLPKGRLMKFRFQGQLIC